MYGWGESTWPNLRRGETLSSSNPRKRLRSSQQRFVNHNFAHVIPLLDSPLDRLGKISLRDQTNKNRGKSQRALTAVSKILFPAFIAYLKIPYVAGEWENCSKVLFRRVLKNTEMSEVKQWLGLPKERRQLYYYTQDRFSSRPNKAVYILKTKRK